MTKSSSNVKILNVIRIVVYTFKELGNPELYNNDRSDTVKRERIDLYIDESGQNTKGELFVVAVVAVENNQVFRQHCETLERSSGKRTVKWRTAHEKRRLDYLRSIMLHSSSHKFKLFYSVSRETTDYDLATIDGIASAVRRLRPIGSDVYVHVDGLPKSKRKVTKLGCDNLVVLLKR